VRSHLPPLQLAVLADRPLLHRFGRAFDGVASCVPAGCGGGGVGGDHGDGDCRMQVDTEHRNSPSLAAWRLNLVMPMSSRSWQPGASSAPGNITDQPLMKARMSGFMMSAWVVHMPCGNFS
jgi:hypothetical protein